MTAVVDMWSSPTTVYTGGLRQLPLALGGRPMLLIADDRLAGQIEAVRRSAAPIAVVPLEVGLPTEQATQIVVDALNRHRDAVPVALGGGSVMDVVRLGALSALDPAVAGFGVRGDGPTYLPTRTVNPTICVPSTVGTASEVSPVAVRTTSAGTAMVISPGLRSSAAIFDTDVTASLSTGALGAGLVEPMARICVPAIAGTRLMFQDGLASGLAATVLALGDALSRRAPDEQWRSAAALASAQTHLGLLAVERAPAGHQLWPLATEVMRATGLRKAAALAALLPAWLRCLDAGVIGRAWGSPDRVRDILGLDAAAAAARLDTWLLALGLPTLLPATTDGQAVVGRVLDPWRASGLFLQGVPRDEIASVVAVSISGAVQRRPAPSGTV